MPRKSSEPSETRTVRVKATRLGYYDLQLRQPGSEFDFVLCETAQAIPSWTECVDGSNPPQDELPVVQEFADLLPAGTTVAI